MNNDTSSVTGETPNTDPLVTSTPATASETQQKQSAKSLEEALARIAELEHSNKNAVEERDRHRKKLSSYEEAERKAQEAALSEVEKATKRATDAEQRIQQVQQQLVTAQVKLAAQTKGFINPELATLAIQSQLEYGDDGMPTNVEKVLDRLARDNPYLLPPAKPVEPETPEPAQPAPIVRQSVPTIPAMNPGRSNIPAPDAQKPGRIPRLSDVYQRP
jgi:hypothetical protein